MLNLKQIRTFVKLVEVKSFTRTASELFMTQPAISWQIKALEEEIGFKLIKREERGVLLTKSGEIFFERATKLVEDFDLLEKEVAEIKNLENGTIRIGASTIPGEFLVPKYLKKFQDKMPNISFDLQVKSSREVEHDLIKNLADLSFTGKKLTAKNGISIKVFEDQILMIVGENNELFQRKEKIFLKDILKYNIVLREDGSATREVLLDNLKERNILENQFRSRTIINDNYSLLRFIEESDSISFVSSLLVGAHQEKKLKVINIEDFQVSRDIYLSYLDEKIKKEKIEEFLKIVTGEIDG